jgi:transcription antitermination factor NusG
MPEGLNWTLNSDAPSFEGGEFCWYALETRHRCEKRVVEQLSQMGIETFLPQRREIHCWSDRRKAVSVPLFAGYAFVRLNRSRDIRLRVLRTTGVIGLLGAQGEGGAVPPGQVEHLRQLLRQNLPCSMHAFLRSGQRIRVRGGCLDGVEGILVDTGARSLVISIDCLQRSLAVRIEGYELDLV